MIAEHMQGKLVNTDQCLITKFFEAQNIHGEVLPKTKVKRNMTTTHKISEKFEGIAKLKTVAM